MAALNIGGHLSLGRKPADTVRQAAADGFRSMQIFASSPGAWRPPAEDPARLASFIAARREYGVCPLVIHAIYLINLASENGALVRKSIGSLIATLGAGAAMGARGVITHIGSHSGRGFDAVSDQVAAGLREILAEIPPEIHLLLENSAGAGGTLGADLHELGELIEKADRHPQLGVALDTAHLAGAGWDFATPGEATRLVSAVEGHVGLSRLWAVHANDAAVPVGSRKDRHANIGEGSIGLEGFRRLLAEEPLRRVPWIMETPDLGERESGATPSLTRLRELAEESGTSVHV